MKKLVVLLFIVIAINVDAQKPQPMTLSIQQAVEIGLNKRYDTRYNKIDIAISDNKIGERKKEWLPNIEVSSDIRYNTRLQTTVLPKGFDAFGNGSNNITLGTKNQSSFYLDLTQPLYRPGLTTDIDIAKKEYALASEKNVEKETDIKLEIVQAYLNAIIKHEQVKFAVFAKERYRSYLKIARAKNKLGVSIENDLLKAELDYKNAEFSLLELQNNYKLATSQLKFNINISDEKELILADSIGSSKVDSLQLVSNLPIDRTELRQLKIEGDINSLKLQKAKLYAYPTVSFYANYTSLFQSDNFNYLQNEFWNPYNSIGVKLSIPITGNIKNQHVIKESKFKIEQDHLKLLHREAELTNEKNMSMTELKNSFLSLHSAKDNLELSRKIFKIQLKNYALGTIAYTAALETETSLRTAEENYFKAIYNYLLSTLNYQKAVGKL